MEIQKINSEISAHKYLSAVTTNTNIETEIFKIEELQSKWKFEKESIEKEVASRPDGQVNNFKIDKLIGLYFLLKVLPSYLLALENILKDEEDDYKQITTINKVNESFRNTMHDKEQEVKNFMDMIFGSESDDDYEEWKSLNNEHPYDENYDERNDYNEDEEN
jgi:hypothetical protein